MRLDLVADIEKERRAAFRQIREVAQQRLAYIASHATDARHREAAYHDAQALLFQRAMPGVWLQAEQEARNALGEKIGLIELAQELLEEQKQEYSALAKHHTVVRHAELKIRRAQTIRDIQNTLRCVISSLNGDD